ncbi:membrane bound O-acyl transferase family-domain-containing protein [Podospora fimiseda]|uniref:Membrane bound O-acyl transferase family-domain-containing protein n=1 Tax=Podospora fimiseda TaxID=252190 RepID=A0AAN7BSF4_9PEZI|nr:membrane bound O-acyl transferase family-domain-containing protein [Podospora fimiseda]
MATTAATWTDVQIPASVYAISIVFVQIFLSAIILAFSSPPKGLNLLHPRFLGFYVSLIFFWLETFYLPGILSLQPGSTIQDSTPMLHGFWLWKYLDDALLSQWSFEAAGPTSELGGLAIVPKNGKVVRVGDGWKGRLMFSFRVVSEARFIGTPWAPPGVPKRTVTGKWEWMGWNIGVALGYAFVRSTLERWLLGEYNPVVSLLGMVIGNEELAYRVGTVMSYYAIIYVSLELGYRSMGLISVGLGITEAHEWFPLFGSVFEARGVRSFWGRFWHQLSRRIHSAPASFITYHVLRLPKKGSLVSRYTMTTLVFTSSGLWHLVGNLGSGIPFAKTGPMNYFCIQSLGIMLEDGFQALVFPSEDDGRENKKSQPGILMGIAGRLWLVLWLSFTTTPWMYPILENQKMRFPNAY